MYTLKDYNNDIIKSHFYETELQLAYIGEEIEYKIEKIIKRRKRTNRKKSLLNGKGGLENLILGFLRKLLEA